MQGFLCTECTQGLVPFGFACFGLADSCRGKEGRGGRARRRGVTAFLVQTFACACGPSLLMPAEPTRSSALYFLVAAVTLAAFPLGFAAAFGLCPPCCASRRQRRTRTQLAGETDVKLSAINVPLLAACDTAGDGSPVSGGASIVNSPEILTPSAWKLFARVVMPRAALLLVDAGQLSAVLAPTQPRLWPGGALLSSDLVRAPVALLGGAVGGFLPAWLSAPLVQHLIVGALSPIFATIALSVFCALVACARGAPKVGLAAALRRAVPTFAGIWSVGEPCVEQLHHRLVSGAT